jgi:hypothetical protein
MLWGTSIETDDGCIEIVVSYTFFFLISEWRRAKYKCSFNVHLLSNINDET